MPRCPITNRRIGSPSARLVGMNTSDDRICGQEPIQSSGNRCQPNGWGQPLLEVSWQESQNLKSFADVDLSDGVASTCRDHPHYRTLGPMSGLSVRVRFLATHPRWGAACAEALVRICAGALSDDRPSRVRLVWGNTGGSKTSDHQCGLNVFPVSSSVFRRERIRGHPSAQAA